jgi:hypothetical protein
MARIVDRAVVMLAGLRRAVVVESTAIATEVRALVQVSTSVKVTASAVVSTCWEVSAPVEAPTPTTRSIRSDASAYSYAVLVHESVVDDVHLPFEETPAPISMSGSSITMPPSSGRPPVPPCSAVRAHLRSASVSRAIGTTLMPVW